MGFFVKHLNFREKSKFWTKMGLFVKNLNFREKIKILSKK